jgi:8-oxo-dGTP diphosphatase
MSIDDHLKSLTAPLRKRTVCFLIDNERLLLGMKKRGFGKGNYLGIGGKVEQGETVIQAAIREYQEEAEVTPEELQEVAVLTFLFSEKPDWNQEVHAFISYKWTGSPKETEEIAPEWFDKDKIPFDKMWEDNRYWIPQILSGNKVRATFLYDENLKVSERRITSH